MTITHPQPAAIDAELDAKHVRHGDVRSFVHEYAQLTEAARVRVVSATDYDEFVALAVEQGILRPTPDGNFSTRSHSQDVARSEGRTFVGTSRASDSGVYNNWRPSTDLKQEVHKRMRGASRGKTMYVLPYLMSAPGSPLRPWAAGVELTDDLAVVLQMMLMARVGIELLDAQTDPSFFVRAVHVTGNLDTIKRGDNDDRFFATIADERLLLHYGSAYGGNALLGKIAHALRLASYDGWSSGEFLAEQFMLMAITDKSTGRRFHVAGGFPSASGKTNLAMTLPPEALGDRFRVDFYGDDIVWLRIGDDGRVYGMNPENGVFGVARDTNHHTNPVAMDAIAPKSGAIFTNVAVHDTTGEVWWEGLTPEPPRDVTGWRDWSGKLISERKPGELDLPWAHPNGRFTTRLANVSSLADDAASPAGVPIDAIIFGGRTRDREPLLRVLENLVEGVYDGLCLGAEATSAAEGVAGQLRYDPMSMRPFLSYPEGDYAAHWLDFFARAAHPPVFAHVNWFQRDAATGEYLWPGYRENLRALIWLMNYVDGEAQGTETPIGVLPRLDELNLEGLDIDTETLDQLLHLDRGRWLRELAARHEHLAQFDRLPQQIWQAHKQLTQRLVETPADH